MPEPSPLADHDLIATIIATVGPRIHSSLPSPDGQWLAEVIIYNCAPVIENYDSAYEEMRIVATEDGAEQVVDSQLQSCGGLGAFGFEGLFWSANSRYFYYTDAREGVPDGGCGVWMRPYKRADVTTGETEWLGEGPLSPDGTMLATWQERELVIWDLNEWEAGRVRMVQAYAQQAPIVWSPDGQSLAYLQSTTSCGPGIATVARVNLPDSETQALLELDDRGFISLSWDEPEYLTLFTFEGQEWRYEFATEELEPLP